MNWSQRLSAAVALTLTLSLPVFAEGHMPTGPGAAPPSAPASISAEGVMDCPITQPSASNESDSGFTGAILNLLEGVLALL